uniref:Uncharacterized protein n=1 Tax=Meloidogyne floridensis TaxID=298350 RepID=A0A915PF28_9BILA
KNFSSDFTLKLLSCPWRVHFADMASMASLVSALSDHHDWIGVYVLDSVLEFLRLSLELNAPALQQRALTTVAYLGQLFNYNVTNTATLFKVLYQLISLGIHPITSTVSSDLPQQEGNNESSSGPEQLIIRLQRIRLVTQLVDTVCEFFCAPKNYETRDGWSLFIDEIDEFPDDVIQLVTELLRTWRKNEKFPENLNEAQLKVAEIEATYKAKVDEILAGMRNALEAATRDEEGQRRLNRITEENEEEEEDDYDSEEEEDEENSLDEELDHSCDNEEEDIGHNGRPHSNRKQHKKNSLNNEEEQNISSLQPQLLENTEKSPTCYFDGDESELRIHTQQKQLLPEDEDFMRDFDKTMNESLQSAPVMLQGPISDLVVPPQAKQKFERKLTFAMSETHSVDKSSPHDLLPPEDVGGNNYYGRSSQQQQHRQKAASPQSRMALMLRANKGVGGSSGGGGGLGTSGGGIGAKGNVLLKAVNIEDIGDNLAEKWRMAQEEQEKNRREMKKVTLALNERMAQEADEANRQEQIAEMEKRFIFTGGGGVGGSTTSNLGEGNE